MASSIQKALKILALLSDKYDDSVTLAEISSKLGINKSTCVRILNTLCSEGYTEKISHSKGYRLSSSTFFLTRYNNFNAEIIKKCRPFLKWIHKKTGETVLLSTLINDKKFIIDYIQSNTKLSEKHSSLIEDSLYSSATARIVLSELDATDIKRIYKKYGAPSKNEWAEVNDLDSLIKNLKRIKRQKYEIVTHRYGNIYFLGCAYGIYNGDKCCGAIGVATRCEESEYAVYAEKQQEYLKYLLPCAREISRRLSVDGI